MPLRAAGARQHLSEQWGVLKTMPLRTAKAYAESRGKTVVVQAGSAAPRNSPNELVVSCNSAGQVAAVLQGS